MYIDEVYDHTRPIGDMYAKYVYIHWVYVYTYYIYYSSGILVIY